MQEELFPAPSLHMLNKTFKLFVTTTRRSKTSPRLVEVWWGKKQIRGLEF